MADKKVKRRLGYGNANQATMITVDGVTDSIKGWSERIGCSYLTLWKRICLQGRSPEEAVRAGNRRLNRTNLTINGETHHIAEWARRTGTDADLISQRISKGWTAEEAVGLVEHECETARYVTYRGKTMRICEWAKKLGVSDETMRARIRRMESGEMPKCAVFAVGEVSSWRKVRKIKHQNWYRGKRLTIDEICKRKGCSRTWVNAMLHQGYTASQILDNPALAPIRDREEITRRMVESHQRNKHLRELKKMGFIV